MQALELSATVDGHRLVVQHPALPDHLETVRVIVLWETPGQAGRRLPPPSLAGMGVEKGDILSSASDEEWETLR